MHGRAPELPGDVPASVTHATLVGWLTCGVGTYVLGWRPPSPRLLCNTAHIATLGGPERPAAGQAAGVLASFACLRGAVCCAAASYSAVSAAAALVAAMLLCSCDGNRLSCGGGGGGSVGAASAAGRRIFERCAQQAGVVQSQ